MPPGMCHCLTMKASVLGMQELCPLVKDWLDLLLTDNLAWQQLLAYLDFEPWGRNIIVC